jgi:hypothetical protein
MVYLGYRKNVQPETMLNFLTVISDSLVRP